METKLSALIVLVNVVFVKGRIGLDWEPRNPAFDPNLYTEVLDKEECEAQLAVLGRNIMQRLQFIDAGLRLPRGILMGNTYDFGNYHQCLGIDDELEDEHIEGKYCTITIAPNANSDINVPKGVAFDPSMLRMEDEEINQLEKYEDIRRAVRVITSMPDDNLRAGAGGGGPIPLSFNLAVCVPKPCTTQEGISGLFFNTTDIEFPYTDVSCRLKDDKPWVPADYVAIVIFSIIGLLTLVSTSYDLWQLFFLQKDSKEVSTICRSFSVYTNANRLTTFTKIPDALECVDGIRSLAMMWVIVGHTYLILPLKLNNLELLEVLVTSFKSLWIIAAPITVDTFFMLSGLLIVYTTAGKLTSMKLLKNLHLFYLNRILRMFPLLAATILLQVSIFHRIADGPQWDSVAANTNVCRTSWWLTLLYVQNYIGPVCLGHSWYLAIDMQLHIISPIILFWVLSGKRRVAWSALTAGLLITLTAATIYIFIMKFPGTLLSLNRMSDAENYSYYYYYNTLTRASPFFVGMVFGYILHLWRGKTLKISLTLVMVLWTGAISLITLAIYVVYPMTDFEYDNQILDSFVNSFQRPAWAMSIGWIIFACVKGYGGPINWFLSHQVWKLPARISYGMYLLHYPMQYTIAGMNLAPIYFTDASAIYQFVAQFTITFVVAFVFTLLIDSPFSVLFKLLLGGGPKKPSKKEVPVIEISRKGIDEEMTMKNGESNDAFYDTEIPSERRRELHNF